MGTTRISRTSMYDGTRLDGDCMKDFIPYIVTAVLAIGAGALLNNQCSSPEVVKLPGEIIRDTVWMTRADTVRIVETKTEYRRPVRPFAPEPDESKCCEELARCSRAYDQMALENWHMGNIEATGSKALPWGTVEAEFSMPRYIQDEQDAFRFTATFARQDSLQVVERLRDRKWYERFGVHFGIYGGVDPFGKQFSTTIGIGIGYEITGIF